MLSSLAAHFLKGRHEVRHTVLTRADEPGDEFFLILDGTASVDVATEKRGALRPGAFFGEISLR